MDKTEELFQKRLLDLAERADQKNIVLFTDFMNLNELNIFHSMSHKFSFLTWKTCGGYETAERQIAAFIPDALCYTWDFPIACLKISPLNSKFSDSMTHRDYLGAILNLGIDRKTTGDILVREDCAYLFCTEKMADFISEELTRIKHTSVICRRVDAEEAVTEVKTELIRGTVASVRLDSVLALAGKASRSSLVSLIENGKVFVNGKMIVSNGYQLKENDIISVRGMGRFRYLRTLSQTKKSRYYIEIEKYI